MMEKNQEAIVLGETYDRTGVFFCETVLDVVNCVFTLLADRQVSHVIIVADEATYKILGYDLNFKLKSIPREVYVCCSSMVDDVHYVRRRLNQGDGTWLLAVGGGTVIDVCKAAVSNTDSEWLALPTQLATDGLVTSTAVLRAQGEKRWVVSKKPYAVIFPEFVIESAPRRHNVAGIGDVLSNYSALLDWKLAERETGELVETVAYSLAKEAAERVYDMVVSLRTNSLGRVSLRTLADAIVISGMAMERVRSSRPCSGAEHLLSHALDKLQNYPLLHGEQVAAFTIWTLDLHGNSTRAKQLWRIYDKIGLPRTPAELGIRSETLAQLEREAIKVRPGRYTILHHLSRSDFKAQTN